MKNNNKIGKSHLKNHLFCGCQNIVKIRQRWIQKQITSNNQNRAWKEDEKWKQMQKRIKKFTLCRVRWWRWLKGHCSRYFFIPFKSLKLAIHKALTKRGTFSILRPKSVSKEHEKFYWHQNRVENSVTVIEMKEEEKMCLIFISFLRCFSNIFNYR